MPLLFGLMSSTVHQRVVIGIKVQLRSVPSYAIRILLFVMPGVPLVFADVRTFHSFIWIGDTESRDANYDQIEVVVIDVVGAAAAYSTRYGRDHPNLIDRWECNASICNPPLRGIHKAYDRSPAIGWKRVIVYVFSFIKSRRGYFFVPKNDTCRTSDFSNIPFTVTGYGIPIQVNRSTPSAWNVYIQSCVSDLKSSTSDPVPLLKDTQTESL